MNIGKQKMQWEKENKDVKFKTFHSNENELYFFIKLLFIFVNKLCNV